MENQRKLAAIMFTDIVGYSAMMLKNEQLAISVLEKNREIHQAAIRRFNGTFVKEIGDGTLTIFPSSVNAVNCAVEISKVCCKEPSLKVRIGIHIADIIVRYSDVSGDGVNIACRIEVMGDPGGIYISEKVYDEIKNATGLQAEYYGEKMLKNIPDPVKIFSIVCPELKEDSIEAVI
jgi:adenylate cyclase